MHRQTDYPYQVPYETDFLYAQRFAYEGLGLLLMDILGTTALVAGLACTATGPASMSVNIGPGRIYSKQNLEDSAWGQLAGVGGLAADVAADHQIIKQGIFRDTTALAVMPAPVTVGQSINYLVQVAFSEVDAVPTSLPFVNATAPYAPIAPQTLNTVRQDKCVVTVKAGTAATTGSQTTPAVDAGNVGIWVITVPYGATTITGTNISAYGSAPFITETLTQKISQATGDARYSKPIDTQAQAGNFAAATGTANTYVAAYNPSLTSHVIGLPLRFTVPVATVVGAATFNPGPGVKSLRRGANSKFLVNDLQPNTVYTAEYDGTNYVVTDLLSASIVGAGSLPTVSVPNDGNYHTICDLSAFTSGGRALLLVDAVYAPTSQSWDGMILAVQFASGTGPGNTPASNVSVQNSPGTPTFQVVGSLVQIAITGGGGTYAVTPKIVSF